ncbi:MAG: NfeD family protein [Erythrobacter sp.]
MRRWFMLCLMLAMLHPLVFAQEARPSREVPVVKIEGAIGPAMADHLIKSIDAAADAGAPMVVIRMDTPGGLDTSMREMIRAIINAPMPVITYVSPSGARAASAGAYIMMASHVAAMAPGTNVGAATPVQLGGGGQGSEAGPPAPDAESSESDAAAARQPANAGEAKALNDAIAYIRSLAELRGRNADWAEAAVRDAASLSAQAALAANVIDLVARDDADLLAQLDGMEVNIAGRPITLDTADVTLSEQELDWRTRLLLVITDPNIALILLTIGGYGLLFEFINPGAIYPGTIGAICLVIGLYALSALPVNYAGLALIGLGVALMVAEAFSPSFGILGIGGVVAFVLGATILFDTDVPQMRVALPLLGAIAVASLAAVVLTVRMALASGQRAIATGAEELRNASGRVLDWEGDAGFVQVHGERWRATGPNGLKPGQSVRVTELDGLTIAVETDI